MTALLVRTQAARDAASDWLVSHAFSASRNLADWERLLSLVAGGALLADSIGRRSWTLAALGGGLLARGAVGHCPVYQALGIDTSEHQRHSGWVSVPAGRGVRLDERIFIRRAPADVFEFWRNLENLPRVMSHLQLVERVGTSRTRWTAEGPLGTTATWEAEIINERAGELIAWRSLPGGDVDTAGSVRFKPSADGFGTWVRVELKYDPPAGRLGAMLARLFGDDPRRQLREDLVRLKDVLEGEAELAAGSGRLRKAR